MAEKPKELSKDQLPIDKETFLKIKENYAVKDQHAPIHLEKIKEDYDNKKIGHELFSQWDANGDGVLDEEEMKRLVHEYKTTESNFRSVELSKLTNSTFFLENHFPAIH